MDPQLRAEPLLRGLEHERQRAEVRHVELLERLDGLGRVLARGAADEREAGQRHDAADERAARAERVVEEPLDRGRKVEPSGKDGDHTRAARLELRDDARVVALVASHQVRTLQHEADDGRVGSELQVRARVVPVEVLFQILEHARRERVPDADVGEDDGLGDREARALERRDVLLPDVEQQVLEVLGVASEPVLQRRHEVARVLRLLGGQVLEHRRQRAHKFQQRLLKVVVVLALRAHELGKRRGLAACATASSAELRERKGPELVELHHRGHRREDEARVERVARGADRLDDLLGQLLDEDERADEEVGRGDVGLERRVRRRVAELLEQVADDLDADLVVVRVDLLHRSAERRLVLCLEDDVDDLELDAAAGVGGADAAGLWVGGGEEAAA